MFMTLPLLTVHKNNPFLIDTSNLSECKHLSIIETGTFGSIIQAGGQHG